MSEAAVETAEQGEGSKATRKACEAVTAEGIPCQGIPLAGQRFCLFHSPDHEQMLAASRRLGGLTRMRALRPVHLPDAELGNHEGIATYRAAVVGAVRDGLLDAVRAGVFLAAARDAEDSLQRREREAREAARPGPSGVDRHSLADLSDEELEAIASGQAPRPGGHAPDPAMLTRPYANPLPEPGTDSPPEPAASPEASANAVAIEEAACGATGPQIATSEAIPEAGPEGDVRRRQPGDPPVYPEGAIRHLDNRGWQSAEAEGLFDWEGQNR
jgi:hypothetical protein